MAPQLPWNANRNKLVCQSYYKTSRAIHF